MAGGDECDGGNALLQCGQDSCWIIFARQEHSLARAHILVKHAAHVNSKDLVLKQAYLSSIFILM
jgi:hypothetical protein